jgi:hypothetical protein
MLREGEEREVLPPVCIGERRRSSRSSSLPFPFSPPFLLDIDPALFTAGTPAPPPFA